jgi:hypothetical protein
VNVHDAWTSVRQTSSVEIATVGSIIAVRAERIRSTVTPGVETLLALATSGMTQRDLWCRNGPVSRYAKCP